MAPKRKKAAAKRSKHTRDGVIVKDENGNRKKCRLVEIYQNYDMFDSWLEPQPPTIGLQRLYPKSLIENKKNSAAEPGDFQLSDSHEVREPWGPAVPDYPSITAGSRVSEDSMVAATSSIKTEKDLNDRLCLCFRFDRNTEESRKGPQKLQSDSKSVRECSVPMTPNTTSTKAPSFVAPTPVTPQVAKPAVKTARLVKCSPEASVNATAMVTEAADCRLMTSPEIAPPSSSNQLEGQWLAASRTSLTVDLYDCKNATTGQAPLLTSQEDSVMLKGSKSKGGRKKTKRTQSEKYEKEFPNSDYGFDSELSTRVSRRIAAKKVESYVEDEDLPDLIVEEEVKKPKKKPVYNRKKAFSKEQASLLLSLTDDDSNGSEVKMTKAANSRESNNDNGLHAMLDAVDFTQRKRLQPRAKNVPLYGAEIDNKMELYSCPMCEQKYPQSEIERHAQDCNGV